MLSGYFLNVIKRDQLSEVTVIVLQVGLLLSILLYPGLILIDYGHFQYPLRTKYLMFTCVKAALCFP